jgi:hypothetical protein
MGPASISNKTIISAISFKDQKMKFFEGPWIFVEGNAINYLRGFRNVTFDIETIGSNLYLTPEYWIDEHYYFIYIFVIILILIIYFGYSTIKK